MGNAWPMRVRPITVTVLVALILVPSPWTNAYAEEPETPKSVEPGAAKRSIPRGPLEVPARIEADSRPKQATFDLSALDPFLQPWND